MKPETHTCACGFTWEHGKSGSHECGPYYRKKIESLERRRSLMSVALSDASAKVEQFALENAALERQVEDLKEQRERTKSSLATVSHALSYAESQASEWRCKAGGMENELRRRELDCAELKEALQAAIAWGAKVGPTPEEIDAALESARECIVSGFGYKYNETALREAIRNLFTPGQEEQAK